MTPEEEKRKQAEQDFLDGKISLTQFDMRLADPSFRKRQDNLLEAARLAYTQDARGGSLSTLFESFGAPLFSLLTEWVAAEAARIAERIVDERIAAIQIQGSDIGGKWLDHPGFRVKPKGE